MQTTGPNHLLLIQSAETLRVRRAVKRGERGVVDAGDDVVCCAVFSEGWGVVYVDVDGAPEKSGG